MKDLSQRISQYVVDGLREFSEHHIKYSSKSLKDLVNDYWDAGIVVASGLALTQHGDNLYGDYQFSVAFLGSILSLTGGIIRDVGGIKNWGTVPPNDYSFYRNIYAGLATIAISVDNLPKSPDISPVIVEITDKI